MDMLYNQGYCLHDAVATAVEIVGDKFVLRFCDGVYRLGANGKETELTAACEVQFEIADIENNVDIVCRANGQVRNIGMSVFESMVSELRFDIDDEFYSSFSRTFLISGYVGKNAVQLYLIGVKNVVVAQM